MALSLLQQCFVIAVRFLKSMILFLVAQRGGRRREPSPRHGRFSPPPSRLREDRIGDRDRGRYDNDMYRENRDRFRDNRDRYVPEQRRQRYVGHVIALAGCFDW